MGVHKKRNVDVVVDYWSGLAYLRGVNHYYDTTGTNIELIEKTLEFYKKYMPGSVPLRVFVEQEGENELQEIIDNEKAEAEAIFSAKKRADTVREMQDRLKAKAKNNEWNGTICGEDIDQIAREMLEDKNEKG